jgi:hypothetical protein
MVSFQSFTQPQYFYAQVFSYVSASEKYAGSEVIHITVGNSGIRSQWGLRDDFSKFFRRVWQSHILTGFIRFENGLECL